MRQKWCFKSKQDVLDYSKQKKDGNNKNGHVVNEKYISNADEYGFGVDHSYPYLKPRYLSMREEIVDNPECQVSAATFDKLLTKSLKLQQLVSKHKCDRNMDQDKHLIVTHYIREYNLIRNETIGIRHIMAIVLYTDCSAFCTYYRATYRPLTQDESEESVTKRHTKLYYYSRALFEAIELFGSKWIRYSSFSWIE